MRAILWMKLMGCKPGTELYKPILCTGWSVRDAMGHERLVCDGDEELRELAERGVVEIIEALEVEKEPNETCQHCRYFYSNRDAGRTGFCHRYPPKGTERVKTEKQTVEWTKWPAVSGSDVCGEFEPRT